MGGSAKAPKETDDARRTRMKSDALMDIQLEQAKKPVVFPEFEVPKQLPPAPSPSAQAASDAVFAEQEERRKAGRRTNAGRGTLFAGESNKSPLGGMKTLLG